VVGIGLMTLVATVPLSPFHPLLPPGEQAIAPLRWLASAGRLDTLSRDTVAGFAIVVIVGAVVGFMFALREAWRGGISMRTAIWMSVAFNVLMLALPLLFSRDVYSYSLYGRIASIHHGNPYVDLPQNYATDPMFSLTGPAWKDTPAVYGPLFTLYSSLLTKAIVSVRGLIFAFKLTSVGASVATLFIVKRLSEKIRPSRAVFAVVLFGWNPVVLFHSVASGHNDLLVALSIAAALALLYAERDLAATAALTLGVLVKASAAFPLIILLAVMVARSRPGSKLRAFAKHAGVVAGLSLLFAAPFLQLKDPTLGMANLSTHTGWLAPSKLFGRTLQRWLEPFFGEAVGSAVAGGVRLAFASVMLVGLFFIIRATMRRAGELPPAAQAAAWGWALLLLMMCGPVLLPWYIVWTLPIAWTLPRVPRLATLWLSGLLAISEVVAEPANSPKIYEGMLIGVHYVITIGVFAVLVWLLIDLRRRIRGGIALESVPPREEVAAEAG